MAIENDEFAGAALVIEDDALIALELRDQLNKLGFDPVDVARNMRDALARVDTSTYAIAIVDIKLDSDSALEAARRLSRKGTPFLFASGSDEKLPADLAGARFLAKPFSESSFADAIRAALAERAL